MGFFSDLWHGKRGSSDAAGQDWDFLRRMYIDEGNRLSKEENKQWQSMLSNLKGFGAGARNQIEWGKDLGNAQAVAAGARQGMDSTVTSSIMQGNQNNATRQGMNLEDQLKSARQGLIEMKPYKGNLAAQFALKQGARPRPVSYRTGGLRDALGAGIGGVVSGGFGGALGGIFGKGGAFQGMLPAMSRGMGGLFSGSGPGVFQGGVPMAGGFGGMSGFGGVGGSGGFGGGQDQWLQQAFNNYMKQMTQAGQI